MAFATPVTIVPGAVKDIDPGTLQQRHDSKGRPLWVMPKPISFHETIQIIREPVKDDEGNVRMRPVRRKVKFPVYRGTDSSYARHIRSQFRRFRRKQEEKAAAEEMKDAAAVLRDFIMNPLGGENE